MSGINDPMLQAKIAEWRARAAAGTLSLDDMKEAIRAMRQGRLGAATASDSAQRARAKRVVKSADEMLDELGG